MRFYTDIEAVLGVWDGQKFINIDQKIETEDEELIALLQKAGLRHEKEIEPPKPKGGKAK
jgi:hypothetical protein